MQKWIRQHTCRSHLIFCKDLCFTVCSSFVCSLGFSVFPSCFLTHFHRCILAQLRERPRFRMWATLLALQPFQYISVLCRKALMGLLITERKTHKVNISVKVKAEVVSSDCFLLIACHRDSSDISKHQLPLSPTINVTSTKSRRKSQ